MQVVFSYLVLNTWLSVYRSLLHIISDGRHYLLIAMLTLQNNVYIIIIIIICEDGSLTQLLVQGWPNEALWATCGPWLILIAHATVLVWGSYMFSTSAIPVVVPNKVMFSPVCKVKQWRFN